MNQNIGQNIFSVDAYESPKSPLEVNLYYKKASESLSKKERLMRTPNSIQQLVLEELPAICAIALHWYRPGLNVEVTPHSGSESFDAELTINGWLEKTIKIEVTSTIEYAAVLQREKIYKRGFAGGVASTHKRESDSSISHETIAVKSGDDVRSLGKLVVDRMTKKFEKKYLGNYVLGVLIDFHRSLCARDILILTNELGDLLKTESNPFLEVYIVNLYDLGLIKL